jgi:hypothetical protein
VLVGKEVNHGAVKHFVHSNLDQMFWLRVKLNRNALLHLRLGIVFAYLRFSKPFSDKNFILDSSAFGFIVIMSSKREASVP